MDPETQQQTPQELEEKPVLPETAGLWAAESLRKGGGAVLEVTRNTWEQIRPELEKLGVDPMKERSAGRLVVFDATKVVDAINTLGGPSPTAFRSVIGETVEAIRDSIGDRPLHIWTEQVSMLQRHEDPWIADFEEALWKEATREHDLKLLGTTSLLQDPIDPLDDDTEGWSEYVMANPGAPGET